MRGTDEQEWRAARAIGWYYSNRDPDEHRPWSRLSEEEREEWRKVIDELDRDLADEFVRKSEILRRKTT